jgi:hypothetical protein
MAFICLQNEPTRLRQIGCARTNSRTATPDCATPHAATYTLGCRLLRTSRCWTRRLSSRAAAPRLPLDLRRRYRASSSLHLRRRGGPAHLEPSRPRPRPQAPGSNNTADPRDQMKATKKDSNDVPRRNAGSHHVYAPAHRFRSGAVSPRRMQS